MTNTNDLREMIALADRLDEFGKWGVFSAEHRRQLVVDSAKALRTAASRADFDAGRVAGQRNMRERASILAAERFNTSGWNAFMRSAGNTIASAIASLPLNVESGKESDGGVVADTRSNETATDLLAQPSPMVSRSCDVKTTACGVAGVAPGPSDISEERKALRSACFRLQSFLDTFGDLGDCVTQADIDDWFDLADPQRPSAPSPDSASAVREALKRSRPFIEMALDHGDHDDICESRELLPIVDAALAATKAEAAPGEEPKFPTWGAEDEAYELGKRDGYEIAIEELDVATGGDGDFRGSTIPGETVDVPAMKARIIRRFHEVLFYEDLRASGGILPEAYQSPQAQGNAPMTDDHIKHMVDRFLMWKLPEHFNPDCGISFDEKYRSEHEPIGTNLLDATQATAMVRHMVEGMPGPSTKAEAAPVAWLQSQNGVEIVSKHRLDEKAFEYGWTERPLYARPPAPVAEVREAFVSVLASLAAAISLLERTPKAKKAAPSDKMFDQMVADYKNALEAGRRALNVEGGAV